MAQSHGHPTLSFTLSIILSLLASLSNAQQASSTASFSQPTDQPSAPGGGAAVPTNIGYGATTGPGFENYYFVLIGILLVLLAVAYGFYLRSRRRALAQRRARGELSTDLEGRTWGGRPWRLPAVRDSRREEGLDERGEAPPAYLHTEPAPAPYSESDDHGDGIALQPLPGKPPDYDAHDSDEDFNLTRPTPAHPPHGRHAWARHLLGRPEDSEPSTVAKPELDNTNFEQVGSTTTERVEGASEQLDRAPETIDARNQGRERDEVIR